ncbi:uncharacterized protein LOC126556266 [Anopheles maculipalpis]|uniref:uncharacterized protein LOC126556266 n=1 Tax=Anopheles maculipalpis TaxID=1496333 RepID=UPI002158AE15|nr:uncharacterized protein LOC126556266 [Anopheles maculipalpis]
MASITIDLNTPFITPDCSLKILRTIFELLLFIRRQIPFPYSTFRTMVNKQEQSDGVDTSSVAGLCAKMQREKAQHVVKCAEQMLEKLEKILKHHSTSELMFLFGKTIYTAKEAFVIKLPPVDTNHFGANHQDTLAGILRKIGLQLVVCKEIVTVQNVLGDTNVFVMLQLSTTLEPVSELYGVKLLDEYKLPSKCTSYAIELKTTNVCDGEISSNCCQQLKIYSEHAERSSEISTIDDTQKIETEPGATLATRWFLLDSVVSGFSLKSAKQNQMWK